MSELRMVKMFKVIINLFLVIVQVSSHGPYPHDYGSKLQNGDEFDFIVVGAGAAGSLVASRLSEIAQWKVLLLEAGGYPSEMSEIPQMAFALRGTEEDWQYTTQISLTHCLALTNGTCPLPLGKGLGGGSLQNEMIYTRSTKQDHARWAGEGWSHEVLSSHYRKLENAHFENNDTYGTSGELHLTRPKYTQTIRSALENAYQEVGYKPYSEDEPIGFTDTPTTIYQGTRQSSAKAFLIPATNRPNFHVAVHAHVTKLLVNPPIVEVLIQNQTLRLRARNEVVLSAGSINTPQILMNSGIGPREHLTRLGIEVLKDLKVGYNYQNHPSFGGLFARVASDEVSGLLSLVAFVNAKNGTAAVQIMHEVIVKNSSDLEAALRYQGVPDEVAEAIIENNRDAPLLRFMVTLQHPKSRGFVRLESTDPLAQPLVFANYYTDTYGDDLDEMVAGVREVQELLKTKAFMQHNPEVVEFELEACGEFPEDSDAFWRCIITNLGSHFYHSVGTCKMGRSSDAEAVVDQRLKVHGIDGIRVVDGSVMPMITTGNTYAPILMIGERGAALIKEDWTQKTHDEM